MLQAEEISVCEAESIELNKLLHDSGLFISETYTRLLRKFPTHPDTITWLIREQLWNKYHLSILHFIFVNSDQSDDELDRVLLEFKQVVALEKELESY